MEADPILGVDESHPIRDVHSYDGVVTFEGGGAYLGMVISTPLDDSERTLARFAEKQRFYLESFFSEYGKKTWGTPRQDKMKIFVDIHRASSPAAFELLKDFEAEATGRGVELNVQTIGADNPG